MPLETPPPEVVELARERDAARAARDFARADELRDVIGASGWAIQDGADGFVLTPKPPFPTSRTLAQALQTQPAPARACIDLLVDGWPADVRECIGALLEHAPPDLRILAADLGNVDGAGAEVHALAVQNPGRIHEIHVEHRLDAVGWAQATTALIEFDPSPVHIVMDLSSILDGDALTPLIDALGDPTVGASGWRGADVDEDWLQVHDAGPGEVDVLLGYLMAVRREAALAAPPDPRARFYRNADLEWSLIMREHGQRLVVPVGELPVHQTRHHGYHDSDPARRDRESRKTYDRLLKRFRGRTQLLAPRKGTP